MRGVGAAGRAVTAANGRSLGRHGPATNSVGERGKKGQRAEANPGEAVDELGEAGRRRRWRSTEMTAAAV